MTATAPSSLCVVVPVFNEAAGLRGFCAELESVLARIESRYRWEVLLVIDPSTDGTEDIARELAAADPRFSAVLMGRRAGHQMSLVAGMDRCRTDVCITMDADLQHPPALIPDMLALFEGGADIVQTVRVDTEGISRWKKGASAAFYRLLNRVSEVDLIESGADFRLLSRRVLDLFRTEIRERNQFLRGLVQWVGLPTATIPFVAPARTAGSSKYSLRQSASLAMTGMVSFSKAPLRFGLILGVVVAGLAVLAGLTAIVPFLRGDDVPAGWTTLAVLVSLLASAQLLTLGLLGVYVGAIFDEVKGRPPYVVREVVGVETASGHPRGPSPEQEHPE